MPEALAWSAYWDPALPARERGRIFARLDVRPRRRAAGGAHPGFSALVDVSPDAYKLVLGEAFSSQFGPVREGGTGLDTDGEVARSQFHFLWPNTMINIFPGRTNLSIGPVLPAGPMRTERFLDYFFGPEVEERWIGELLEFDGQVGAED